MSSRVAKLRLALILLGACDSPDAAPPAPKAAPVVVAPKKPAEPAPTDAEVAALTTQWQQLIDSDHLDEADKLCAGWLAREHPFAKAEGFKCAANVLVRRGKDSGDALLISDADQRLAVGGLATGPRFSGASLGQAIDQLDQAARLHPTDSSIHEGRLFLAIASGNYARAVGSLEASFMQLPNAPAATWLQYADSFPRSAAPYAVAYVRLVAMKHPSNAGALAALGAWLAASGEPDEAKPYLEKALVLDDKDPLLHWRLGEVLESLNDRVGADAHYRQSLALGGSLHEERARTYKRFKKAARK